MSDLVGQQLGNYRLIRLLGQGGFAEVYLGKHVHLGTTSALKVLYTRLATDEQERFLQEARTIAHLSHPNIIRVLDFGIENTMPFLVIEYAPGGSLRHRYPKGTQLSTQEIRPFVKQASAALDYAHKQQVIHRDVKPENMLLGKENELLLSDFGIALIALSSHAQSTQEVTGTAAYMAPEQIQGKPLPASDQYALGIVVYEWLSGDWPFHGSFSEVCSQHLFTPPPPMREKVSHITPAVEAVVEKALAKDPQQRFPTLKAMADAFEKACEDEEAHLSAIAPTIRRNAPSTSLLPAESLTPTETKPKRSNTVLSPTRTAPRVRKPFMLPSLPPRSPERSTTKRKLSRRALLISLGIMGAVTAGGIALYTVSQQEQAPPPTIFTDTPEPVPSAPVRTLGSELFTYRDHTSTIHSVTWSPNGQYMASGSADATVRVWNTINGDTLYIYPGHTGLLNTVYSVVWSPDGRQIASASADNTVQIWDAATGNQITRYQEHTARVLSVAWSNMSPSPNTPYIASASGDKTVQVWDANTGTRLARYTEHANTVYTVIWSPIGPFVASAGADRTVQIWDPLTEKRISIYRGHSDTIYAIAWSPDGRQIASAGGDATVQVWDVVTGTTLVTYRGHSGLGNTVSTVAWSPDGKQIASGGTDKTVQIWDSATGQQIYTYDKHKGIIYTTAWTQDGRRIASGSADSTVQIWQAT